MLESLAVGIRFVPLDSFVVLDLDGVLVEIDLDGTAGTLVDLPATILALQDALREGVESLESIFAEVTLGFDGGLFEVTAVARTIVGDGDNTRQVVLRFDLLRVHVLMISRREVSVNDFFGIFHVFSMANIDAIFFDPNRSVHYGMTD